MFRRPPASAPQVLEQVELGPAVGCYLPFEKVAETVWPLVMYTVQGLPIQPLQPVSEKFPAPTVAVRVTGVPYV